MTTSIITQPSTQPATTTAAEPSPPAASPATSPAPDGKFGPPFLIDISWDHQVPDKPADTSR